MTARRTPIPAVVPPQSRWISDPSNVPDIRGALQGAIRTVQEVKATFSSSSASTTGGSAYFVGGDGDVPEGLDVAITNLEVALPDIQITDNAIRNAEYLLVVQAGHKHLARYLSGKQDERFRTLAERACDAVGWFLDEVERWSVETDDPIPEAPDREQITVEQMHRQLQRQPPAKEGRVDDNAVLSCGDLAEHFGVDPEALRKRLERLRKQDHNCFVEVAESERKPRESRYLYRMKLVRPVIDAMKTSAQSSGERPAKKN